MGHELPLATRLLAACMHACLPAAHAEGGLGSWLSGTEGASCMPSRVSTCSKLFPGCWVQQGAGVPACCTAAMESICRAGGSVQGARCTGVIGWPLPLSLASLAACLPVSRHARRAGSTPCPEVDLWGQVLPCLSQWRCWRCLLRSAVISRQQGADGSKQHRHAGLPCGSRTSSLVS